MSPPNEERGDARQNATPSTPAAPPTSATSHDSIRPREPARAISASIRRRLLVAAPSTAHRRPETIDLHDRLVAVLVLDEPAPRWVRRDRIRVAHRAHRPAVAA